jgi:hypothetical protein
LGYDKFPTKVWDCGDSPAASEKLDEQFESRVPPPFKRQTQQVLELMPALYLHGLASGDFELALRQLLGEGASPIFFLSTD